MKALRIGLLTFVPAKTGIVGTLFDPVSGRTADGTYKKRRNGVQFFDAKDRPWFFLVANKYNERFFVSTGESNGKIFYAFGLAEDVKNRIGLSYSKLSDLANEVWEKVVEGRELETNPPMYAHHLNEIKAHGLSVKQMRRLYAMVSRGNQKAITFARNVLGIPFSESPSQVKAVVLHHVRDLAERRVRRNPARSHRERIAIDTVRHPMKGYFLGGPDLAESVRYLRSLGYSMAQLKKLNPEVEDILEGRKSILPNRRRRRK